MLSAVRENFKPEDLDWSGYEFRHLQTGRLPLSVEIDILFSEEEIETTRQYAQELRDMGVRLGALPSNRQSVTLSLEFDERKVKALNGSAAAFFHNSGNRKSGRKMPIRANLATKFIAPAGFARL